MGLHICLCPTDGRFRNEENSTGQQRAQRFQLNQQRFSHAFFQHMLRRMTYELLPASLHLVDLGAGLLATLSEVIHLLVVTSVQPQGCSIAQVAPQVSGSCL